MSRIGKSIEEEKLVVVRGWRGEWGVAANGFVFGMMRMSWNWMGIYNLMNTLKATEIHCKWVNCMVYELYLNKLL